MLRLVNVNAMRHTFVEVMCYGDGIESIMTARSRYV